MASIAVWISTSLQLYEYFSQYVLKGSEISSLLVFKDRKAEWEYVRMKDPMFKYYVLSQVVLILCVYLIQNLTLERYAFGSF